KQVRRLLLLEGGVLALVGGLIGTVGGLAYARAMLGALSTVWRDAVAGSVLEFHVKPVTLILGAATGIAVAWITIGLALRNQASRTARELLTDGASKGMPALAQEGRGRRLALIIGAVAGLVAAGMVGWSVVRGDTANAELFFTCGAML